MVVERKTALEPFRQKNGSPDRESSLELAADERSLLKDCNALAQSAALLCGVETAFIYVSDVMYGFFSDNTHINAPDSKRNISASKHFLASHDFFETTDAAQINDAISFIDSAYTPQFLATTKLSGYPATDCGALCIVDEQPQTLDTCQRKSLMFLGEIVENLVRRHRRANQKYEAENESEPTEALSLSESLFRVISDSSPLGIFATDHKGYCIYTNESWQNISGHPPDLGLAYGWNTSIHPEDKAEVFKEWQRTIQSGLEFNMEFRIQHSDDSVHHVRVRSRATFDSQGHVSGSVGTVADITEYRQILARLKDEEERFRTLYESTPVMTYSIDQHRNITTVSDRWLSVMGYVRDQVIGESPLKFLTEKSREYAQDIAMPLLFEQGYCDNIEYQMITKSGKILDVLLSAIVEKDSEGNFSRGFAVIENISRRKEVETKLREDQQYLETIIEGTGVGTWRWNLETGDIQLNEQWAKILGYRLDELEPFSISSFEALVHPDDREHVTAAEKKHLSGETLVYNCEFRMRHRSGQWVWVLASGKIQRRLEDGSPEWMFGTHLDITEMVSQRHVIEEAHSRMKLATASGQIGIWEYDMITGRITWDDRVYQLYGFDPQEKEMTYEEWITLVHPEDKDETLRLITHSVRGQSFFNHEFRVIWRDGSVHYLRATAKVVRAEKDNSIKLVGVNSDVTDLRNLAADLAEQHELLQVTLASIGDAVITTDKLGKVTWLNPVAQRMTGWQASEVEGKELSEIFHIMSGDKRINIDDPVSTAMSKGNITGFSDDIVLVSKNGEEFGIENSAAPIKNEEGELLGAVLVFHDVTEQRRLAGEISYQASHDALTGLFNRTEFESRLDSLLKRSAGTKDEHVVMYIDLDQFKIVNDSCGHSIGDELLQDVSKILKNAIRGSDMLARLGGDEFGIILECCNVEQGITIGKKICFTMEDYRFYHEERRFRIGASIGLVSVGQQWESTASLIQAADTSCYAAKEAGRNRVHVWFDADQVMKTRHGEMQWATRLEHAIDENRFALYAQRIERISGEPKGYYAEVLLRMIDTDGKIVLPGAFISAAERFHLAARVDRWVLANAVDWLINYKNIEQIDTLSINLSGQSIGDRSFHRQAFKILSRIDKEICKLICIEITETTAVTNLADASTFIDKVRSLGVRIALDDFGAGASSFGYLKKLEVDILKIDGQFIKNLITDPLDTAAVRCFIDVAGVVDLTTVAEFVDNPEVLARLKELGVDYAQGFLLHKPEPIDQALVVDERFSKR